MSNSLLDTILAARRLLDTARPPPDWWRGALVEPLEPTNDPALTIDLSKINKDTQA